ncbi:MAG: hypothetical protein GY799_12310 [Desulfobulbaceae bacterium]|nr:hypothetical protein [Desulfobulbaceae bacterium]
MFNSIQIKKAWEIRRAAANEIGCGVLEISWKECLELTEEAKLVNRVISLALGHIGTKEEYLELSEADKLAPMAKFFDSVPALKRLCENGIVEVLEAETHGLKVNCVRLTGVAKIEIGFESFGRLWEKHGKKRLYVYGWDDTCDKLGLDYRFSKIRKLNNEVPYINVESIKTTEELIEVLRNVADRVAFARVQAPIKKYLK